MKIYKENKLKNMQIQEPIVLYSEDITCCQNYELRDVHPPSGPSLTQPMGAHRSRALRAHTASPVTLGAARPETADMDAEPVDVSEGAGI